MRSSMCRGWLENFLLVMTIILTSVLFFFVPYAAGEIDPHGTLTSSTDLCEECHKEHDAPTPHFQLQEKGYLLRKNDEKEICYSCHNGTAVPPSLNVQEEFGDSLNGGSSKTSLHPVPDGTLVCSNCHTSHMKLEDDPENPDPASHQGNEVVRLLRVKLGNFWAYLVSQFNTAWTDTPNLKKLDDPNKYCSSCHGIGSVLPGGDLVSNYLGSAHEGSSFPTPSPPLSPIQCNVCHLWHGSDFDALLQPTVSGVSVSGNDNSLCYTCHISHLGAFGGQLIFEQTKHFTVTSSTVADTKWPKSTYGGGYCLNCHDPHGTSSTDFRRSDKNSLCTACHDSSGVIFPTTYSYQGKNKYESSAHNIDTTTNNVWVDPAETGAAVGSGGSTAGECINCHNPMGKDNGAGAAYERLLLRWAVGSDSNEENLCYGGSGSSGGCHAVVYTYGGVSDVDSFYGAGGTRSSNIYESFNPTSPLTITAPSSGAKVNQHHDISYDDQVAYNPSAKLECDNCHNPHLENKEYDFVSSSRIANPDDLSEKWIAKYQPANTFDYNSASFRDSTSDLDPSFGANLPDYINYCLSCHDNNLPSGVSFGVSPSANIAQTYAATSNPIGEHGRGNGRGSIEGTLKYPYFGSSPGDFGEPTSPYAAMNCTDCHDSHGSSGLYSLKSSITIKGVALTTTGGASSFIVSDNTFGGPSGWCTFCHNLDPNHETNYGSQCSDCHYHGSDKF